MSHRLKDFVLTAKGLVEILGADTILQPGLIVQKDVNTKIGLVRFAARYDGKGTFTIKVVSTQKKIFSGQIDITDNFPGIEYFVAGLEGIELDNTTVQGAFGQPASVPENVNKPMFGDDLAAVQQIPHKDEIWIMNCFVEQDNGFDIRYRAVDSYGGTYGAPRVLVRSEFMEIFTEISKGVYQLAVKVIKVETDSITYVQLDGEKKPTQTQKTTQLAPFVASFIPESACY